jgi:two-component system NtrC family sensor kinase
MSTAKPPPPAERRAARRPEDFWALAQRIAQLATQGVARIQFLSDVSDDLRSFSDSDAVEFWNTDTDRDYVWRTSSGGPPAFSHVGPPHDPPRDSASAAEGLLMRDIRLLMTRLHAGRRPGDPARHAFHARRPDSRVAVADAIENAGPLARSIDLDRWPSILLLPLDIDARFSGLLILAAAQPRDFSPHELLLYEQVAAALGRAIANRRAQFRLRERIKELTCLHGISQVVRQHVDSLDDALRAMVDLLPAAMQFPEIATARIVLDDRRFAAPGFRECEFALSAPVEVAGRPRGCVEVRYTDRHQEFVADPFLPEEHKLLSSVAGEIALLVERAEAAAARETLAEQLRHAERLATIGQLAAGVAHELNEPLGNILGFAQLLQKQADLSAAARSDADQIVRAALHGREIVRKLLTFARQTRTESRDLDLNDLIRDGLYFLEARCRSSGVELRLELAPQPLVVCGDPSQLTQVLVNLAVNAIQAMPSGGTLTIRTAAAADLVCLAVEDTGVGMDAATRDRLFTPFFTTKDVGEGTGLGLSVVHGIVTAHGGTIRVESEPGRGARFEIRLPAAPPRDDPGRAGET